MGQHCFTFSNSFYFCSVVYLNATCPNWDALLIGDYETIFPVTYKTKFGYRYLPQPPFTSQLGAYSKLNIEAEQQFYGILSEHFKLIDIGVKCDESVTISIYFSQNTYTLNYSEGYKFNQNTKRNVLPKLLKMNL